jgi:hypothetical protein
MSYTSRVYRQRNPHTHDKDNEQPNFFGKTSHEMAGKNNSSFFQAKLSVGQPNDVYEKEADAVADRVVNNRSGSPAVQQKEIKSIQKLATPLEEEKLATNEERMREDKKIQEKPDVQLMCPECEKEKKEKEKVQAKSEGGNTASPQVSSRIEGSKGRGNSLPRKTLGEMNHSFGTDFSDVVIHTDSEASQLSRQLGAQAFTYGNDIYFNSGKYNPDSSSGKQLLAHELTHVIQQGFGAGGNFSSIQRNCEGKSYRNCGGSCTHPTSGYPGTCRWTGLTNGCKCFENPRSSRTLEEVLPFWIMALLSAAAIALLAACFATGVCEAGIIIGAAGAAVGAIIIGIFEAAGVTVTGQEA